MTKKEHYAKNKDKWKVYYANRNADPERFSKYSKYNKELYRKRKFEILSHYSNSEQPFCKFCGFKDMRALQLDHINDDGANDRRANGSGNRFFLYLLRNKFPEGYQVLCANCNQIKEMDRRNNV